jgi:fermentation-respiration switch protein FrsA (DUF1100 family)
LGNFFDQLFVYHPTPWIDRDWARVSALPLEDVWFRASDGTSLFGWYAGSSGTPAALLWCHGNAGNIIHRLENLVELHRLGLSVFLFDYRGYGRSSGKPSEEGLYQDALAAYAYLTETRQIPPQQIVLFGRSLGAAVAGEVASRRQAAGLILETPFPSIEALAAAHSMGLLAQVLLGSRFDLADRLRTVHAPVLVVHGDRDDTVPIGLGRQVFEAANAPKAFYVIPGANHNDTYRVGGRPYFQRLKSFIQEVVK